MTVFSATSSSAARPPVFSAELGASFEPATFEKEIYALWKDAGCFEASDENRPGQNAYTIVIPPPNVTGALHMGHALTATIEDTLIRYHRMKGDNTLWLPGVDHAGIATQMVVEREIAKEKKPDGKPVNRFDLGREKFLERVWKWKELHGNTITSQHERLGASVDWKRERFTMDEGFNRAVRKVFVTLFKEGLIYRGERLINWCPRCQTALSDLEVVPTERKGSLWHIRYAVEGSKAESLTVATTRPETLLGDLAVAVHPDDKRYTHLRGKKLVLPLTGRKIAVIQDAGVDPAFGTGAVKVTPSHDFNDYDMGLRHSLGFFEVIGKDGRMTAAAGSYQGLSVQDAREKVVKDLEAEGTLVKVEPYTNKVGLCQRCDRVAEPLVSKQWFVKIKPLAEPAIAAVRAGKIRMIPETWEATYFEWMENIRDWCVSRQLWWGHQIPAWYCSKGHVTVSETDVTECSECPKGSKDSDLKLERDPDVLDTWFSSALWPFATLGWPEKTKALSTFYPNSVLETGFDIIFFWVARMIMMGLHFMKEPPFHTVFLHAMVRDEKGQKMSKTKGNVINPVDVIEQHGTDPLRFTLAIMAGQGRDIKLSLDRVSGYRAFCNKLWNATKYFHLQHEKLGRATLPFTTLDAIKTDSPGLELADRWILSRLARTIATVNQAIEKFEINTAAQALYEFTWHELCDWYIELTKPAFDAKPRPEAVAVMGVALDQVFRALHPFAPFVTERLWQSLPEQKTALRFLMKEKFPTSQSQWINEAVETQVGLLKRSVEAIRNFRGENRISPKIELTVAYRASSSGAQSFIKDHAQSFRTLARIKDLQEATAKTPPPKTALLPLEDLGLEFWVPLEGLIDFGAEIDRLKKEIQGTIKDLEHTEKKFSNPAFSEKAPPELIAKEKTRIQELTQRRADLEATLKRLGG